MVKRSFRVLAMISCVGLAGCNMNSLSTNQTFATLGGGLLGGLAGSQFGSGDGNLLASGVGVALGAFLGSQFGSYLDEQDRELNEDAAFSTYSTGSTREWSNPDTGRSGSVTGGSSARNDAGDKCQVQTASVTLDNGSKQESRYRLCRGDDGEYYTQPI